MPDDRQGPLVVGVFTVVMGAALFLAEGVLAVLSGGDL